MLVLQSAAVGIKYGLIPLKMFSKNMHAINIGLLSVLTTE